MPLGRSPAERYALRLRSACKDILASDPSFEWIGDVERSRAVGFRRGYAFWIEAKYPAGVEGGRDEGFSGPEALVLVSDDGDVTIDADDDFPEPLLACVVHRAEILGKR